jgi:hypothetical protein
MFRPGGQGLDERRRSRVPVEAVDSGIFVGQVEAEDRSATSPHRGERFNETGDRLGKLRRNERRKGSALARPIGLDGLRGRTLNDTRHALSPTLQRDPAQPPRRRQGSITRAATGILRATYATLRVGSIWRRLALSGANGGTRKRHE